MLAWYLYIKMELEKLYEKNKDNKILVQIEAVQRLIDELKYTR
jgi:hypothetical protein